MYLACAQEFAKDVSPREVEAGQIPSVSRYAGHCKEAADLPQALVSE